MAHWKAGSDKTVNLEKLGVVELVPITSVPARHKLVGTRWVLKLKADSTYKGQLVAQGFSKVLGVDCGGTFAPVRRFYGIRMMLTITAELDYEVHVLDVHTVLLNADVKEDVFVHMTPGLQDQQQSRGSSRHEDHEDILQSPAEPEELVRYDGCGIRQSYRLPPTQVGSMRAHLQG